MFWMVQMIGGVDADSGAVRIGDQSENMDGFALLVCGSNCLEREGAGCENHFVSSVGHALGDGVGGGNVTLRVETAKREVNALFVAFVSKAFEYAVYPILQDWL